MTRETGIEHRLALAAGRVLTAGVLLRVSCSYQKCDVPPPPSLLLRQSLSRNSPFKPELRAGGKRRREVLMADKPTSIRRVRPSTLHVAGGRRRNGSERQACFDGKSRRSGRGGRADDETMHAAHSLKDASSNIELGR